MVTHCFSDPRWDLTDAEPIFVQGTIELLTVIIPAAIVLVIWQLYVTNRSLSRPRVSTLGLNDSIEDQTRSPSCVFRVSPVNLFIYATTALVAFDLGWLAVIMRESWH